MQQQKFLEAASVLAALLLTVPACHVAGSPVVAPLRVAQAPAQLPADGFSRARIQVVSEYPCTFDVLQGQRQAKVTPAGHCEAVVRAGVMPGHVAVRVTTPEHGHAVIEFEMTSVAPSVFLPLHDEADQQAFRRWFTFLAEVQAFREPSEWPRDIVDCAALLRYAYREALREHDAAWLREAKLPLTPSLPSVAQYAYPYTPLQANLFQTGEQQYAQFADARTLQTRNAFLIGRDVSRAQPGDLLFYRQLSPELPFHSMIYLGPSQIDRDGQKYVVYHTGEPVNEIRRPSLDELMRYPEAQWRPVAGNPNFLGVYRWNILRKGS